jgi:hypothetical protein
MILNASIQPSRVNRWLKIILVVLLVSSVWHVASHEIDISSDSHNVEECQVCRLNHIPTTDGAPVLSLTIPLVLLAFVSVTTRQQHYPQFSPYTLGARAPPQS